MNNPRVIFKKLLTLWLLWVVSGAGPKALGAVTPPEESDAQQREVARGGIDLLMDGDLDAAMAVFREIQKQDPPSPLGYLLEADAMWWKIYFATGNLVDPDVFDVVSSQTTPNDQHFDNLLNAAINESEARIRARQDVARNYLYQGMAYALRARLMGLRGRDLPTARASKKMRSLLLEALRQDPNLTDAYLGVGIYNYFVDTLPTIVKILKFFIGLPGGSRRVGLQQLQQAAEKGELTRAEAKFYLAKNFSRGNERQYEKSQQLFQELAHQYPNNPLWPLVVGSLHCRLGRVEPCEALYREVYEKTAGEKSEVKQALHRAAKQALERRHPTEKFGH